MTTTTIQTLDHAVALLTREARNGMSPTRAASLLGAASSVQSIINGLVMDERRAADAAEKASKDSNKETKVLLKSDTRKGVTHVVKVHDGEAQDCSCEHSTIRDAYCKHMRQVDNDIRFSVRRKDGSKI